jgi:AraC-like DNA-binding protein
VQERYHWAGAAYLLLIAAEKLGFEKARVLERAGMKEADLPPSPGRIPWTQLKPLTSAALEVTGEAGLGLLAGRLSRLPLHGIAGIYAMHLSPGREILEHGYRTVGPRLTNLLKFWHEESDGLTLSRGELNASTDPLAETHLHLYLGVHLTVYRGAFGDKADISHIAIRSTACGSAQHLTELMRCCEVRIGQPGDWLAVPREMADRPLPLANPWMREQLQPQMDAFLSDLDEGIDATLAVQTAVEGAIANGKTMDLEGAAAALRINPRTLRARLAAEGTTFSAVLDAARMEFALRQIRIPGVKFSAVGAQAGYSDPAAFTRAFRRWTGGTPKDWQGQRTK